MPNYTLAILLLALSQLHPASFAQESMWELHTESALTMTIFSEVSPLKLNKIHSWELVLKHASGEFVTDAQIAVTGGMPLHDHGLPTQPRVSGETKAGHYLLEGLRFHMPGPWQLVFTVQHSGSSETLTLDFAL